MTPVEGGPGRKRFFDAEKVGIAFIVGAVAVVALAGIAFAFAGPVAGLLIIVVLVGGFVFGRSLVDARQGGDEVEVLTTPDDGVKRLLVVAHEGLGDERLERALEERAGEETHVYVLVPAPGGATDRLTSDQGARDVTLVDLERLVAGLSGSFADVRGDIGDPDPRIALEDGLRTFAADEIILVNPPEDERSSMEEAASRRAQDDVPLRVTELNV